MKTILISVLATASMIATGLAGAIPSNTKVKLELVSVTKTENNKVKPSLKVFKGVPSGLKVGGVYEFKMGGSGKLVGPKGIDIAFAKDSRLEALQLAHLKIPGATNFYVDKKTSGTANVNAFVEFGAAFQKNNKGKPVAITVTYLDIKVLPKLNTQSITYVFEAVSK